MRSILILFTFCIFFTSNAQELWKVTESKVHFFSEAPLENIEAENVKSQGLLKTTTKDVAIVVPIIEFDFEKPLMEEHFNENYMETSKFKTATFKGTIQEDINFKKEGKYEVTAKGVLKIHGVEQERTLKGELEIKGNSIMVNCKFPVALADHDIEIPKMVIENLAEVVKVTFNLKFEPK